MEDEMRILKPYIRGFPLIIFAVLISFMISKKYLSYVTPLYESTAKLKLADVTEGVTGSKLFKDLDVFATSNRIAAEIEVLKSEVLLNKVFNELDFDIEIFRKGKIKTVEIYEQSPIKIQYIVGDKDVYDKLFDIEILNDTEYTIHSEGDKNTYNGAIGVPLELPDLTLLISLNDSLVKSNPQLKIFDTYQFQVLSRQKLLQNARDNLDISTTDKDIPIIRISYRSPVPVKAERLANKLTIVYIEDYIENKHKAANITVDFLIDRIKDVENKLSNSEHDIQNFRDRKNITNINQETETDLRQLAQLEIQQTNIKMNLEAIQELENYLKEGKDNILELAPNFEAFTYLLSTELVKKIKDLQADKKDLLLIYTAEHEKVRATDAKIEDLTNYLIESVSNTRINLEIKLENISHKITTTENRFIGIPNKEKMLKILTREFEIYQQSYTFLNEKKMEAEIAQAAKIAFHRIITHAQVNKTPVSPNRLIITIVSALLGMFVSIALIYLVHLLKGKVNDEYTVETNSTIPVLMLTPLLKSKQEIEKHFQNQSVQLEIRDIIKPESIICFGSFEFNQGAAFNSLHLAMAMAMQKKTVLLIDVNNALELIEETRGNPINYKYDLDILNLTESVFSVYTKGEMKAYIEQFKGRYDRIIILNETLESQKSWLLMTIATSNIIFLDTRLTPANKIIEVDIMKEKFKLPGTYFGLNRVGYNPDIIKELLKISKDFIKFINQKIHK